MDSPRPLDALMFRLTDGAPAFKVCAAANVSYWRWCGWYLLASERDIRLADVADVQRDDETRGRRD